MAKGRDQVDQLCEKWARVYRELAGLTSPKTASGFIGALRCTLAARRDLHAGATSTGRVERHFPEVFVGDALLVNLAFRRMPPTLQEIMVAHYVVLEPRNKTVRAELMGLSRNTYWERVGRAKTFIDGALAISENVRTFSGRFGGISGTRETSP